MYVRSFLVLFHLKVKWQGRIIPPIREPKNQWNFASPVESKLVLALPFPVNIFSFKSNLLVTEHPIESEWRLNGKNGLLFKLQGTGLWNSNFLNYTRCVHRKRVSFLHAVMLNIFGMCFIHLLKQNKNSEWKLLSISVYIEISMRLRSQEHCKKEQLFWKVACETNTGWMFRIVVSKLLHPWAVKCNQLWTI